MRIKLGTRVKDCITGFTGIAVARTEWVNGCTRYGVQSETLIDGKPGDEHWFDERALEKASRESGGPCSGSAETG